MGENNTEILKNIKTTHEKLSGMMVNASLTNRMKHNISTLLDINIHYCDIIINTDGTRQYVCKTDDDVLRIIIQDRDLLIFSDKKQELFARYTLPAAGKKKEPEKQWYKSLINNTELYDAIEKIRIEFHKEPDDLFYALVAWGEWEEPVHFRLEEWERRMEEIKNAQVHYDYQINCNFRVRHNLVQARSNSVKNEIWIAAAGSGEFVKRIEELFL